ncbi:HK97-gp10 family putative phage morphogenesis protein [Streptomyces sp. NPDC088732]|uniref:HK97-gp10 family putative phage morphogenesis protein n=1 Tax=Streptomyces sp. NPDC088732 TaxID=3365879 RepID=UPI00381EFAE9
MARRRGRGGRSGTVVQVQVEGLDRLRARLEELAPELLAAAKPAVKEAAESVKTTVQQHVRVDSGNLRDSVDIRYQNDGLQAEIGWRDRDDDYAALHEHGTRRIPANPVLGPALDAERAPFPDRIRTEVRQALP